MAEGLNEMWWREEILQAMFWMRGEGIAEEVTAAGLVSFLAGSEQEIARHLERLAKAGDLVQMSMRSYRLSDAAVEEAAELFARDFDEMVNRAGHGSECSRPDCLCHTLGPEQCRSPREEERTRT